MARLGAQNVPEQALAGKLGRSTLLLQQQSMPCWSNGIMTETKKMDTTLTIQCYKAASSFGGTAMNAQTAGRLAQTVETIAKSQVDALVVLGASFVSATH